MRSTLATLCLLGSSTAMAGEALEIPTRDLWIRLPAAETGSPSEPKEVAPPKKKEARPARRKETTPTRAAHALVVEEVAPLSAPALKAVPEVVPETTAAPEGRTEVREVAATAPAEASPEPEVAVEATRPVGSLGLSRTWGLGDSALEAGLVVAPSLSTSGFGFGSNVGLDLGVRVPLTSGVLAIHLRTLYQHFSKDGEVADACASSPPDAPCLTDGKLAYHVAEDSLDFGLRAAWRMKPADAPWSPYGGFALKIFLLKATATALQLENWETETQAGFAAFGGAQVTLGPGHGFAELEYQWSALGNRITGESHLAGFTLSLGYRLVF